MIIVWMPVFNEAANLQAAIDSVLTQSFADFCFLISDNHSTDGSSAIIDAAVQRDPRVRKVMPPQHVPSMDHMRFLYDEILDQTQERRYSIFMGGHDLWRPDLLATLLRRAESAPNSAIVYTDSFEIDGQDRALRQHCGWVQAAEIARPFVPQHVLLGLTHNMLWGGLWRENLRRSVRMRHRCVGFDHLMIAEMALTGEILYQPGSAVFLRQAKGAGSWEVYVKKHLPAETRAQPIQDFLLQLEWASDLVDRAAQGDSFFEQPAVRAMLKNSLLSAYICRYWPCLGAFEGGTTAFFGHPKVQQILATQSACAGFYAELLAQAQPLAAASPLTPPA